MFKKSFKNIGFPNEPSFRYENFFTSKNYPTGRKACLPRAVGIACMSLYGWFLDPWDKEIPIPETRPVWKSYIFNKSVNDRRCIFTFSRSRILNTWKNLTSGRIPKPKPNVEIFQNCRFNLTFANSFLIKSCETFNGQSLSSILKNTTPY